MSVSIFYSPTDISSLYRCARTIIINKKERILLLHRKKTAMKKFSQGEMLLKNNRENVIFVIRLVVFLEQSRRLIVRIKQVLFPL